MSSYAQKLRDPRWQKKRLEVLEASGWRCELCCDSESPLHVHHKQYFKGREPWDYEIAQLAVLCECCHDAQHESQDVLLDVVSRVPLAGPFDRHMVAYIVAGLIGHEIDSTLQFERKLYELGEQMRNQWWAR